MQLHYFSNGGFVIHKMAPSRTLSAWYDAAGNLLDAEQRSAKGRMRKPSAAVLQEARDVGKRYAKPEDV